MSDAEPPTATEPIGIELVAYLRRDHPIRSECPGCRASINAVGITRLAYAFEACRCGTPDYEHLIERVWHLSCLSSAAPDKAANTLLERLVYAWRDYGGTAERQAARDAIQRFLDTRRTP